MSKDRNLGLSEQFLPKSQGRVFKAIEAEQAGLREVGMFIGQFARDKEQSYLESSKPENIKNVTPGTLGLGFKMQNTFSYLSEQQFSPLKASSKYIETKDEVGGFSNGCLLFHLSLLSLLENWGNAAERRDAAYIASQFPFC